MTPATHRSEVETIIPDERQTAQILDLVAALEARGNAVEVQPALVTADGVRHELPRNLADLLATVARALAQGQGVSVVPRHRMLTTQEAADMLNVSRPTLIKVLEEGRIPFEMRGSHRRVHLQDVLDYQIALERGRGEALDRMQQQSKEDGLYELLDVPPSEG